MIPLLEALLPGREASASEFQRGGKRPFEFNWMLVVAQFTGEHFNITSGCVRAAVL